MSKFPDLVILLPGITGSVLANENGKEILHHRLASAGKPSRDLDTPLPLSNSYLLFADVTAQLGTA